MNIFFISLLILFLQVAVSAHGISPADMEVMREGGNLAFMKLGASHMLTGYDHLLFLFGIVFFLTTIKDIIKFVTLFTLGHSITLILATFMNITTNYYLIDAIIAISVMYKGFDNNNGFENYLGVKSPNILVMVFIFGLIHGFGLSMRLQELPLGEENFEILFKIISFNIGVEIGQIIALVVMLLILQQWRKYASFIRFAKVTNHILIFAGFMLFLMQMHGYTHMINEEDFGFNKDAHRHIHIDMKAKEEKMKNYHDAL